MSWSRRRWFMQLSFDAPGVQLFEWLCREFEVNRFCGISVSGDCKLKVNIVCGKRTNLNIHSGNDCHLRKLSWTPSPLQTTDMMNLFISTCYLVSFRYKTNSIEVRTGLCLGLLYGRTFLQSLFFCRHEKHLPRVSFQISRYFVLPRVAATIPSSVSRHESHLTHM